MNGLYIIVLGSTTGKLPIMAEDAAVGSYTISHVSTRGFAYCLSWLTSNDLADYTLNNPDTLTKYKTAAQISLKVLEAVTGNVHSLCFVWDFC